MEKNTVYKLIVFCFSLYFFIIISVSKVSAQACITRQQAASDSRCLFIISNKVYEKGTRASPHQGHPCGTDVTSIIPSFHTNTPATYLSPNYRTDICAPTPTTLPPTATPRPTATSIPPTMTPTRQPTLATSPTNIPGGTRLTLSLKFHGIGNGGDNANSNAKGTFSPVRPQRTLKVQVLGTTDQLVKEVQTNVTFSSTTGEFQGIADLGNTFTNGVYGVKVSTPMYLQKRVSSVLTITQGQNQTIPTAFLIVGDASNDNKIDVNDYNLLLDCYSDFKPARACSADKKLMTDFTDDGFVNQYDYNLLLREISVQQGN